MTPHPTSCSDCGAAPTTSDHRCPPTTGTSRSVAARAPQPHAAPGENPEPVEHDHPLLSCAGCRRRGAELDGLRAEALRLLRWKSEALPVLSGLQEVGQALGLPLGAGITGRTALDAALDLRNHVKDAKAERDRLAATVERVRALAVSNGAWKGKQHIRVKEQRRFHTVTRSAVWVDDLNEALDADAPEASDLTEQGRRLASEREDLIARGVNPTDLEVPSAPKASEGPPPCPDHREAQHRDGNPPWCKACGWHHGRPARPATSASQIHPRASESSDGSSR